MTKKDYLRAVRTIVAIEKAIRHNEPTDTGAVYARRNWPLLPAQIDRVMEIVTAQIALAFAEDSPSFNSFMFADAVAKARKLPRR